MENLEFLKFRLEKIFSSLWVDLDLFSPEVINNIKILLRKKECQLIKSELKFLTHLVTLKNSIVSMGLLDTANMLNIIRGKTSFYTIKNMEEDFKFFKRVKVGLATIIKNSREYLENPKYVNVRRLKLIITAWERLCADLKEKNFYSKELEEDKFFKLNNAKNLLTALRLLEQSRLKLKNFLNDFLANASFDEIKDALHIFYANEELKEML